MLAGEVERSVAREQDRVFRLPRSAYLAVFFLALCVTPLVQHPIVTLAYVVPVAAAMYIARTATIVDDTGITVRALSARGLAEEAPEAYKDVERVVEVVERAGLAARVARLRPIGVVKG